MTTTESQTCPTSDVFEYPIEDIQPSPENDQLYRPVNPKDPDIKLLADSIRAQGVLEPLVISSDGYILSGHRRHCSAKLAGLRIVPCREMDVSRVDDPDEFLRLLREFNRQRVKTFEEVVREEVVDINADEAHERLRSHRAAKSEVRFPQLALGPYRARKKISPAKTPMLVAILKIIEERHACSSLGERTIHYKLLNDPPLKHASKPNSRYQNDKKSSASLSDLCTRARIAGLIPMDAISDETRPVVTWDTHLAPASFVRQELQSFMKNYWRDLMQSQPNHIELLVEKNTIAPIIRPVAADFCISMTSGRGYSSFPPRYEMAQRFKESGAEKLIIIIVSDFDPDGERIAESFARSMRDDFGLTIHPIKASLTYEQTQEFNLPFGLTIQEKKSKNKKWFIAKYGNASAFEVDALEPEQLQAIVRNAVESVIDVDAYNREVEKEKQDAAYIEGLRNRVNAANWRSVYRRW
ncbi:MAG: ParB/RepB/Spo0J family partition protein [Pirellulaceae bacterium]